MYSYQIFVIKFFIFFLSFFYIWTITSKSPFLLTYYDNNNGINNALLPLKKITNVYVKGGN